MVRFAPIQTPSFFFAPLAILAGVTVLFFIAAASIWAKLVGPALRSLTRRRDRHGG